MSLERFYSRPGHLLRRLNQIAIAIFIEETTDTDLTTVQYAALKMAQEIPNIDQASLSSMIAIDKTSMVKVLDRLAEKGLITRTRSQTDRRSNLLNVTEAGLAVLRQVDSVIDRIEQRILAPLNKFDQTKFLKMLTQLVHVNNSYSRAPLNTDVWDDRVKNPKDLESTVRPTNRKAESGKSEAKKIFLVKDRAGREALKDIKGG